MDFCRKPYYPHQPYYPYFTLSKRVNQTLKIFLSEAHYYFKCMIRLFLGGQGIEHGAYLAYVSSSISAVQRQKSQSYA